MSISLPRHLVEDFRATCYFLGKSPSDIIRKQAIEPFLREHPSEITVKRLEEQLAQLQERYREAQEVIAGQQGIVNKKAQSYINDEVFRLEQGLGERDLRPEDERDQRLIPTPGQVKKILRGAAIGQDIPMLDAIKLLVERLQRIDGQRQPNYQRLWFKALKQAKLELQEEGLLDATEEQQDTALASMAGQARQAQAILLDTAQEIAALENKAGELTFPQAQQILEERAEKKEKMRRDKNGRFSRAAP